MTTKKHDEKHEHDDKSSAGTDVPAPRDEQRSPAAPRSTPYDPPHLVTVGRVVHFYDDELRVRRRKPHAAIVAAVDEASETCTLVVFGCGVAFGGALLARRDSVAYSEKPAAGRWSWQPRV